MNVGEQLFSAMSDVGEDLVIMAETQRLPRSAWQRILSTAACLAMMAAMGSGLWYGLSQMAPQEAAVLEEEAAPKLPTAETAPPDVTYTIDTPSDSEAQLEPAFVRALDSQAFYIYDPDPETDDTPSKAIAPDGTVLLEVDAGRIEPLIDQYTGAYIAILVCHMPSGVTIDEFYYDIYTLDGQPVVSGLQAYDVDCLGNMILVLSCTDGIYNASLYERDTYALLRDDFWSGMIVGDCIWMTPGNNDGTVQYLFDRNGVMTVAETPVDSYFGWEGRTYFVTNQGEDGLGLMDSYGVELIPGQYIQVCYGITNGYARCEDENGHCLVDIATGREVFRWPYDILEAYENCVLVHTENYSYQLLDWEGNVLLEGLSIRAVDDEADGQPELFVVAEEDSLLYVRTDGEILAAASLGEEFFVTEHITSRTMAGLRPLEDGTMSLVLLNLTTGEETVLSDHDYSTFAPIWEDDQATGLLYAAYVEEGETWCDIVREDGTVLLRGLSDLWTRQGDVFFTDRGNTSGLLRLDGTWLYQAP